MATHLYKNRHLYLVKATLDEKCMVPTGPSEGVIIRGHGTDRELLVFIKYGKAIFRDGKAWMGSVFQEMEECSCTGKQSDLLLIIHSFQVHSLLYLDSCHKVHWRNLNRLLTRGGHGQNFTPVARPANVHGSHGDEVTPSVLQLDHTLTGGYTYYRSEEITRKSWHHCLLIMEKVLYCTILGLIR